MNKIVPLLPSAAIIGSAPQSVMSFTMLCSAVAGREMLKNICWYDWFMGVITAFSMSGWNTYSVHVSTNQTRFSLWTVSIHLLCVRACVCFCWTQIQIKSTKLKWYKYDLLSQNFEALANPSAHCESGQFVVELKRVTLPFIWRSVFVAKTCPIQITVNCIDKVTTRRCWKYTNGKKSGLFNRCAAFNIMTWWRRYHGNCIIAVSRYCHDNILTPFCI